MSADKITIKSFQFAFAQIPSAVLYDGDIDAQAKCVYINMLHRSMNEDKTSYPSVSRIAKDLGLSKDCVLKRIAVLVSQGLITKEQRFDEETKTFSTNIYTILPPFMVYGEDLIKKAYPQPAEIAEYKAVQILKNAGGGSTSDRPGGSTSDRPGGSTSDRPGVVRETDSKYKKREKKEAESEEIKIEEAQASLAPPHVPVRIVEGVIGQKSPIYGSEFEMALFFNGVRQIGFPLKKGQELIDCYRENFPNNEFALGALEYKKSVAPKLKVSEWLNDDELAPIFENLTKLPACKRGFNREKYRIWLKELTEKQMVDLAKLTELANEWQAYHNASGGRQPTKISMSFGNWVKNHFAWGRDKNGPSKRVSEKQRMGESGYHIADDFLANLGRAPAASNS